MKIQISIIVATLNSEKHVYQTIMSALDHNIDEMEVIVVDGGSTDKTLKIIKELKNDKLVIIEGKDTGIAEAWNKGLKIAKGCLIAMLNSDDYYKRGVLNEVIDQFNGITVPVIGYGNVSMIDSSGDIVEEIIGKSRTKIGLLNGFGFMHTSVICNRLAYDKIGSFNQKLRVAIDTEWLLRGISSKVTFMKISNHVYMRKGGLSAINNYTGMGEYADALLRNGYGEKHMMLFFIYRAVGHILKVTKLR